MQFFVGGGAVIRYKDAVSTIMYFFLAPLAVGLGIIFPIVIFGYITSRRRY
jgi:hypothetical protein